MKDICIIKQPAGLGDILYTLKIAALILEKKKAKKIIWPVNSVYNYINEYIDTSNIYFVDERSNFEGKHIYNSDIRGINIVDNILMVNLHRADEVIPTSNDNKPMYCKYELVELDYKDWHNFVKIKRNYKREKKLEDYINNPKRPFKLVNRIFCTYPDIQISPIPTQENEVQIIKTEFDNIFDWCGLMEMCSELHTVETSFCYLARLLNLENVYIYPRNHDTNFKYISQIFPESWKYVTNSLNKKT